MSKKLLALLLAVIMLVGLVPMTVMADGNVAKIGTTEYATLEAAFTAAKDGDIVVLSAGNIDASSESILNALGGKTVTIKGAGENKTILDWGSGKKTAVKSKLTFTDMTLGVTHSGMSYTQAIQHVDTEIYENVTFNFALSTQHTAIFRNCTFNNSTSDEYLLWAYQGDLTAENCVFYGATKAHVKLYGENGNNIKVSLKNCVFNTPAEPGKDWKGCDVYVSNKNNSSNDVVYSVVAEDCTSIYTNYYGDNAIIKDSNKASDVKVIKAGTQVYPESTAVAKIGETEYATLAEAISAVGNGETITMLCDVEAAGGISVPGGKNFTVDFANHKYLVEKPGAGSTGTKTQAFQLLKGSTITFKNGTIACTEANKAQTWVSTDSVKGVAMVIQNYCDLTLENMTIDGTNIAHNGNNNRYVVSNNNGTTTIKNSKIIAVDKDFAFDSFYDGDTKYSVPTVNVEGTSEINGRVGVTGGKVNLKSGSVVNGEIRVGENSSDTKIKDGVLTIENGATVNNKGKWIAVFGQNTLNVAGTVNGYICTNGYDYNAGSVINVNEGANITATGNGIDVALYMPNGTLNVTGGTITGDTAVYFKSTNLNITGGKLVGTGVKAEYKYDGSGANATGDALVIDSCNYPNGIESVVVSGGEFVSTKEGTVAVAAFTSKDAEPVTGFITGGTFSSDVTEYLAAGYKAKNVNNTWTVKAIPDLDDDDIVYFEITEDDVKAVFGENESEHTDLIGQYYFSSIKEAADYIADIKEAIFGDRYYYLPITIRFLDTYPNTTYPQAWVEDIDVSGTVAQDFFGRGGPMKIGFAFNTFNEADRDLVGRFFGFIQDNYYISGDLNDFVITDQMIAEALESGFDAEELTKINTIVEQIIPYLNWDCDFEVAVDGDFEFGDINIAGQYDSYSDDWFAVSAEIEKNKPIRLLEFAAGAFQYQAMLLMTRFNCGVVDNYVDEAIGKTMTVELKMYETDPEATGGDSNLGHETGTAVVVETKTYTFPSSATTVEVVEVEEKDIIIETPADTTLEKEDVAAVKTEVKALLEQTGTQNETADTKKSLEDALKATVENNATALVDVLKEAAEEQGLDNDVIEAINADAITTQKLEIKFNKVEVKAVEDTTFNSISYNVTPVVVATVGEGEDAKEITTEIHELALPVTFRLAVNFAPDTEVLVFDDGKLLEGKHTVQKGDNGNYVELSSKTFSNYTIVDATELTREESKVVGLFFNSAALTVADALDLKFTVVADEYTDVVVKALVGGKEQVCEKDNNDKYIVEVSPEYINDNVQLQLYGTNGYGTRYCTIYEYSVKKYCDNQLAKFNPKDTTHFKEEYRIYTKDELENIYGILYYDAHDDKYNGEGIVVHPADLMTNAQATAVKAMDDHKGFWGAHAGSLAKQYEDFLLLWEQDNSQSFHYVFPDGVAKTYEDNYNNYYLPNEKNIALKALLTNILEYGNVAKNMNQTCETKYNEEFYESRGKYIKDSKEDVNVVDYIASESGYSSGSKLFAEKVHAQIVLSDKIDVRMTFTLEYPAELTSVFAEFNGVEGHTEGDPGQPRGIVWDTDNNNIITDDPVVFTEANVTTSDNKTYTVTFDGLNATEIDDVIKYRFDFKNKGHSIIEVSVYSLLEKYSNDKDYKNITKAAQNYGLAADYYAYILTVDKR